MSKVALEAVVREGDAVKLVNFTNVSSSTHRVLEVTVPVGQTSALTVAATTSERFMVISPRSTETRSFRLADSSASRGLKVTGTQFLSVPVGGSYGLYTTESTSLPMRVVLF